MLKINQRNTINLQDWDRFVTEVYKKRYSFQQQDGCKDRGIHTIYVNLKDTFDEEHENTEIPLKVNGNEMGVKFDVWLQSDPNDHKKKMNWQDWELHLFWDRNFYPDIDILAHDLCKRGLLQEGEYDIIIDW